LMKREALRHFDGALAMNQARVSWLFMPKRDRFTQSSFTRSLCSRKRSAAESGGTGTRLRNSCALRASVLMLRSHSSWPVWAINALLFDYRSDYRRNCSRVKGDYRKEGRSSTNRPIRSERKRTSSAMARGCASGRSRSWGLRFNVDSLNEFECLRAGTRRTRSSSLSRSGLIGATPFRSRNSAVEEMFCSTSAMQAPAPSKALEESGQIDDRRE
jgi:hypothetical protein